METLEHLSDVIGSRLTGSPAMKEANMWTRDRMAEWGMENTAVEPWGEFGRGWSYSRVAVDMLEPRQTSLIAIPMGWTPGTGGPVEGEAMMVKISEEEDFEEYAGKLDGKILLMDESRPLPDDVVLPDSNALALKMYTEDVIPDEWRGRERKSLYKRVKFRHALREFMANENVLATVRISKFDHGVIEVGKDESYGKGEATLPPSVYMASNHYNQLARLLDKDYSVRLRIDIDAQFHEDDLLAYNTVAEIPGRGSKRNELVLLGGHLDSLHGSSGATDNAAGSSVVMEAARILQAIDARPRRTIRVVLWSAEEEGSYCLGSQEYLAKHFATRPISEESEELELPLHGRERLWPITPLPDYQKVSVYFNLDNGSGKILGIFTEDDVAAAPIFEAWLKPFHDLGATKVLHRTGGSDNRYFNAVGLPAFHFIQDMRDYITRTHHTNLDDVDYVQREDLMQASVIMASFVYHAAMREDLMPRKPIPQKPPKWDEEVDEE